MHKPTHKSSPMKAKKEMVFKKMEKEHKKEGREMKKMEKVAHKKRDCK